jgi:hypothetical protein
MTIGFGLIALQLFLQHRRMHHALKASPIEMKGTGVVTDGEPEELIPEQRQIEGGEKPPGGELTPAYLTDFFKRFPLESAKIYADVFIDHWMQLPVTVVEMKHDADGKCTNIKFGLEEVWNDGSGKVELFMDFRRDAPNYLSSLSRYERVTIRGQVKKVTATSVALYNCEVIVPTISELAMREKAAPLDPTRPVYLTPEYLKGLFEKYASNPKAMNKETKAWGNRWVEIIGEFVSSSDGEYGLYLVSIKASYLPKQTQLFVDKKENPHVILFKPGERVKVTGIVTNFSYDHLMMDECFLAWADYSDSRQKDGSTPNS